MSDELNGLDANINARGFFERVLREREKLDAERDRRLDERFFERDRRLDERFTALSKALELQAVEYARRLHDLNGEYQRDRQRQTGYVSQEKFDDNLKAEKIAREAALLRVDEKFEDYVKRYEVRQREVDLLLAAQSGAADEAKRAVEEAVRKSDAQSRELARRQSRNLGLASLGLGLIVFFANVAPVLFNR